MAQLKEVTILYDDDSKELVISNKEELEQLIEILNDLADHFEVV